MRAKKTTPPSKAKSSTSSPKAVQPKGPETEEISAKELCDSVCKEINTSPRFRGKVQAIPAADYDNSYDLRRPTGLLSLDIALGGGFPAGGSSQVFGARSSGKTHLCYCVAGQVQKNYGDNSIVAIGISEMLADIGFMRMSGFCVRYSEEQIRKLEVNRVAHGRPEFTDEEKDDLRFQIGQVLFLSGTTGGDLLESTLEVADRVGSRCQLMIIDSLGSLLTPEQDEKTVSDKHYGGSSGIITLWQTKMQPKFAFRNGAPLLETTIIGINQVRAMIGGPVPGATRAAAGSKAWEHAQLINLECKQGEHLWRDSKHVVQSGRTVKWNIKKGKAGTHDGHKGEFNWYFFKKDGEDVHEPIFWKDMQEGIVIGGADKITDLVEVSKALGIVEMGGAWRTIKDQDGKLIARAQGDEALAEKIASDPELEEMLREGCIRAPNLNIRYR